MRDDFSISVRSKVVAELFELRLESGGVLDDSVVDDCDMIFAVGLRVRVALIGNAVGRPTGMRDSEIAVDGFRRECRLESGDFSRFFSSLDSLAVHDCDAGRI